MLSLLAAQSSAADSKQHTYKSVWLLTYNGTAHRAFTNASFQALLSQAHNGDWALNQIKMASEEKYCNAEGYQRAINRSRRSSPEVGYMQVTQKGCLCSLG